MCVYVCIYVYVCILHIFLNFVLQGGEIFGSMGFGGQMAWADPKNKLGWAYVTNHFNQKSDMMDNRYLTLYKALYDVIPQK